MQIVFIKAWETPPADEHGSLLSWLLTVAGHDVAHELARNNRRRPLEEMMADPTPGPDACAMRNELYSLCFEMAVAEMPQPLREAFLLKWREGKTDGEIVALLGITYSQAASRVHRAKRFVEEYLARHDWSPDDHERFC